MLQEEGQARDEEGKVNDEEALVPWNTAVTAVPKKFVSPTSLPISLSIYILTD